MRKRIFEIGKKIAYAKFMVITANLAVKCAKTKAELSKGVKIVMASSIL
jgi:hypothetical protein